MTGHFDYCDHQLPVGLFLNEVKRDNARCSGGLSQIDLWSVKVRLKPGTKYDYNHTSGHASMQSLKEICELIAPTTAIIPIHKDADADYHALGLTADLEQKIVDKSAVVNGIEVFIDNQ